MSLGIMALCRNEAPWIGFHILSMKDFVKEWVFFDGNSTDGTLEILDYMCSRYKLNVRVFKGMDPKDLKDDYVRMFNDCLKQVKSDYAAFLHPDMICVKGPDHPLTGLAYSVNMRSFAGDPGGQILEFTEGRTGKWKSIMKNDLGLHYFGHYGSHNEDMYFRDITGDQHELYTTLSLYPYDVVDSGIELFHYSDVRPYKRRLDRMITCLLNQNPGMERKTAFEVAKAHPRVSFQQCEALGNFSFKPAEDLPEVFTKHGPEIAAVLGKRPEEVFYLPIREVANV